MGWLTWLVQLDGVWVELGLAWVGLVIWAECIIFSLFYHQTTMWADQRKPCVGATLKMIVILMS